MFCLQVMQHEQNNDDQHNLQQKQYHGEMSRQCVKLKVEYRA